MNFYLYLSAAICSCLNGLLQIPNWGATIGLIGGGIIFFNLAIHEKEDN